MKKLILILITVFVTQVIFSQKKELKSVDKLIKSNDFIAASSLLESIQEIIDSSDEKTKAKFYYLNGLSKYQNRDASFENKISSIESFNLVKSIEQDGSKIYTEKVENILTNLFNSFVND